MEEEGCHFARCDYEEEDLLQAVGSTRRICCGFSEGSTVEITNVEVDIFNEKHQFKSTSLSAVKVCILC